MSQSLRLALEYLLALIHAGEEFPDAAYRTAQMYRVNQLALERAYDENP